VLNQGSQALIQQAIKGEKILSALNAHTLTMDIILSNKDSVQISVLRKTEEKNIVMFVATLVKEFSKTVRTVWGSDDTDRSTQDKYVDVAINMINEFYYWKLEEFAVFFRNAMKGIYERPMGNIDMECLLIMGDQYSNARATFMQRKIHNETFGDADKKPIEKPDEIEEAKIKKIFEDLKKSLTSHKPVANNQSKVNALCQDIMREFDKVHRQQNPGYTGGATYVEYKKQMLSCSEYLKVRFDELYKKENTK
jgi:hypothetical protein